jgi:hypothetical protein
VEIFLFVSLENLAPVAHQDSGHTEYDLFYETKNLRKIILFVAFENLITVVHQESEAVFLVMCDPSMNEL